MQLKEGPTFKKSRKVIKTTLANSKSYQNPEKNE